MDPGPLRNQNWTAARHCFERGQPPSLLIIGKDEPITGAIEIADLVIRKLADKGDVLLHAQAHSPPPQRLDILRMAAIRASQQEPDLETATD